jgi:hypothetical protein
MFSNLEGCPGGPNQFRLPVAAVALLQKPLQRSKVGDFFHAFEIDLVFRYFKPMKSKL